MVIRKRSGVEVPFNGTKITNAILKANVAVEKSQRISEEAAQAISADIEAKLAARDGIAGIEDVQDLVEDALMQAGLYKLAKAYIKYRFRHAQLRQEDSTDKTVLALAENSNADAKEENSNKNPTRASTQRDYTAGEVSKSISRRMLLPEEVVTAHDKGVIHFHDMDYYLQHIHNCDLVNLEDMLQNGTVITDTLIEKPHKFSTACNIATQIIAQVASNQYGGQTISTTHLAPFVKITRMRLRETVAKEFADAGIDATQEQINKVAEERVLADIKAGVQTLQYQILTLMTTNGQTPFVTVSMYLNECGDDDELRADLALVCKEILEQRYEGVKNESGVWITPAFPKLIYVMEPDNAYEGSEYFWLTKIAAKCAAKRLVPDIISEKKMLEYKIQSDGTPACYPCMGCRSFLTPYVDPATGKGKYYGRFNQGVVTINLPYVALDSRNEDGTANIDAFWEEFDEYLELCHRALRLRHERLRGTLSDTAPILWQYGALARLKKGETIDKLLYGGYSTLSLGYAGLYEAVMTLTGHSHTSEEGKPIALAIMQHMNDKCNEWKAAENIAYSLYGTPIESTTYKFAKALQKDFGIIKDISDHGYITNSYHVNVRENIDAFQKLSFEAEFQRLSPGGAISYVETPNMQGNLEAVIALFQFIYENIQYAELNTKSDYCQVCGWDGEIDIVEENGKLLWECPNCHNRDQSKMNVARRTCGYIGSQFWNQGRTQEIRDRVLHI